MIEKPRSAVLIPREEVEPGGLMKREVGGRLIRMSIRQIRPKDRAVKKRLDQHAPEVPGINN